LRFFGLLGLDSIDTSFLGLSVFGLLLVPELDSLLVIEPGTLEAPDESLIFLLKVE